MIISVFLCFQTKDFSVADRILLYGNSDIKEAFIEMDRDDDGEVGNFLLTHLWVMKIELSLKLSFSHMRRRLIQTLLGTFDGDLFCTGYQMRVVE